MPMRKAYSVLVSVIAVDQVYQRPVNEFHFLSHQLFACFSVHLVVMVSPYVENLDIIFLSHFSHGLKEHLASRVGFPFGDAFLKSKG